MILAGIGIEPAEPPGMLVLRLILIRALAELPQGQDCQRAHGRARLRAGAEEEYREY